MPRYNCSTRPPASNLESFLSNGGGIRIDAVQTFLSSYFKMRLTCEHRWERQSILEEAKKYEDSLKNVGVFALGLITAGGHNREEAETYFSEALSCFSRVSRVSRVSEDVIDEKFLHFCLNFDKIRAVLDSDTMERLAAPYLAAGTRFSKILSAEINKLKKGHTGERDRAVSERSVQTNTPWVAVAPPPTVDFEPEPSPSPWVFFPPPEVASGILYVQQLPQGDKNYIQVILHMPRQ